MQNFFSVIAELIEKTASKLEGCLCHSHTWTQKRSHRTRAASVSASTGPHGCVWKGRMGAWWVAIGICELLDKVSNASSTNFDKLVSQLTPQQKALALAALQQVRAKLTEILKEKLDFWNHLPWKILGIWYCCLPGGGDLDVSKKFLQECLDEYDTAVAQGMLDRLHRVAAFFSILHQCMVVSSENGWHHLLV